MKKTGNEVVDITKEIVKPHGWNGREWLVVVVAALVALVFLAANAWWLVRVQSQGRHEQAVTALENCTQIEVIKEQIRGSVRESIARLPTIEYYQTRPKELEEAIEAALGSVARFAPADCYASPGVRSEIERPRKAK